MSNQLPVESASETIARHRSTVADLPHSEESIGLGVYDKPEDQQA